MKKIHMYKEKSIPYKYPGYRRMYCGIDIRIPFTDRLNMTYSAIDVTCKRCRTSINRVIRNTEK